MGKLHVFVQGLFVVTETSQGIEMVFPDVPGHVYLAGSWLAETPITKGSLLTLNVPPPAVPTPGDPRLQTFIGRDFMINLPDRAKLTQEARAVTILFPKKPLVCLGLQLIADPDGGPVVTCPGEPALNVQRPATAHVMVFEFDDQNGIELLGHLWEPYSVEGSISLHLISTSVEAEPWGHNEHTEAVLKNVVDHCPDYRFTPRIAPPEWRFGGQTNYGDTGSLNVVEV